jgi:protein disulfide-isomerase-like protein
MVHGNISGGGRQRNGMSSVDFYRRVPKDLTEATTLGAFMSLCAMLVMALLFSAETFAFARTNISTEIALDDNTAPQIQLNFNITLFALQCDYVSVDVWDVLGTNRQNVTKNIEKWQVDKDGKRKTFSGRNRETREVKHQEHRETLEDLHENGVHVTPLNSKEEFFDWLDEHEMAFVNFFAPWCMWCQRLHPTWEKVAEEIENTNVPVGIANVDCQAHSDLCREQRVMAFPTLRWYEAKEPQAPDYKSDRTVTALVSFARRKLELNEKFKDWDKKDTGKKQKYREMYSIPENPGCQVSGTLMVNRVPGNFHIEAKSVNHNLNAAMTNLTHRVNHLSFGEMGKDQSRSVKRALKQVPESLRQFTPLDGTMHTTREFHKAHHHYIKVVSTHLNMGYIGVPTLYQFLEQSQIVAYDEVNVPEARFSYDLSPMSVVVEKTGRKWYDYLTSLCAIIGGTFTTLGLIDAVLYKVFKPKKL